ncbi:MAG: hypothetical protein ACKOA0_00795, partial [Burkholderiaceae bacterium]
EATQGYLEGLVFFNANNGHEQSLIFKQRRAREYNSELERAKASFAPILLDRLDRRGTRV